ncbi:hypothetical protein PK35_02680 [Tamlana nanhaiensis]|uniref:Uncharacterized protein n=1 Tax=Neotamlana nanhaiensis TaxID=1382798 RepID=A0A0D7WAB4_9FLAO|nr:hypothetical protein [Tamlana nanhaiensis]KJD34687.1 hypothetical protein PK35_02680 [Tamlana nanhaiensis]
MNEYKIEQHIHLFSSWAAGRASSVQGSRFRVEIGQKLLSSSKVKSFIMNPDLLPNNREEFNLEHRNWRLEIIDLATKEGFNFTHGVSAKLINVYLKSIIICGGYYNHPKAKFIHPPIDRVLLGELAEVDFNANRKFWNDYKKIAWSKFNSEQYEKVIYEIQKGLIDSPLWLIEKYWKGYQ